MNSLKPPTYCDLYPKCFAALFAFLTACSSGGDSTSSSEVEVPKLGGVDLVVVEEHTDSIVYTAQTISGSSQGWVFRLEGNRASLFSMDEGSGELQFVDPPVYSLEDPAANLYQVTIVLEDQQKNADRKLVTIQVVNDYRVEFLVPATNANLALGEEALVPVLLKVYEADGGHSLQTVDVTVNGESLHPNPNSEQLWQGLISAPKGESVLTARVVVGSRVMEVEQSIQNRITFTEAWSLAYDPTRDTILVADAFKKRAYAVDAVSGEAAAIPLMADFQSYIPSDLVYSEYADRFYFSSWGLFSISGDLQQFGRLEEPSDRVTWGLEIDEQRQSLLYYGGLLDNGVYRRSLQHSSESDISRN